MVETGFHFAQPGWFWALALPVPVAIWLWRSFVKAARGPIHRYADPHLLPHLTGTRELKATERWDRFLRWSALWTLLIIALAGPRWDYEDIRLFHPGNNLLILLDISRSMQVDDVAPSRLGRARQEIQDLILQNRQVRLGLIAFASVPHVLSPVTEDTYTILNSLPALSTELARLQGSRLHQALDRAEILLDNLPEDSARSLLLISDGDLDESGLAERIAKLAARGIRFHALGIGTPEGARVPAQQGDWIHDRSGQPVLSALDQTLLQNLTAAGQGIYRAADYRDDDTEEILEAAAVTRLPPKAGDDRTRIWNERFYLPLLALALLLLPNLRERRRMR